ncbi:MAG: IS630 family transposase, partial [Candidatus Acidiferrales bacterium]
QKAIRRGTFGSVKELVVKIERFVHRYNAQPRPFSWTATPDSILEKIQRLCERMSVTQH